MKKLYILLMFLVATSIALHSCKPEKEANPEPRDFKAPQDVIDYYYFNEGSYWVFQDSISNQIDSIVLSQKYKNTSSQDGNYYEELGVICKSYFDDFTYRYYINTSFSENCLRNNIPNSTCYSLLLLKSKSGSYSRKIYYAFFKPNIGYFGYGFLNGDNTKTEIVDVKAFYEMDGLMYNDVIVLKTTNNYLYDNSETIIFVARGIGTIRKEIIDQSQVWKLKNYKIN